MSISAMAQPQLQGQLGQLGQQPFPPQWGQPQQFGQLGGLQAQQPYGAQQLQQQPYGGQLQASGQQPGMWGGGQQPLSSLSPIAAQVVSDTVVRVVSASLATVLEQLRIDPLAQQSLCQQGQLSPQAFSNVITESARRCAPIVAQAFSQITAGAHQQIFGQAGYGQQGGMGQAGMQQPLGYGQQQGMGW
ncbi:hypothetical protein [Catellatospora sp. NPDC049609]|uniref:hypothetical protein n=1 Tax=Catellatospora sp. NPDC049609 TaxID=3155505 RepID=UPI003423AA49